ncbi:Type 2A phosphatase-associated protein 42 [Stygiomarasmius scandens]|uniref:Type 2A phosphatase-associated protein 42 n=1 Tax=Marasmiellus scandens TaxID=2682957 RepID=A0ABR1K0N4_9AGAR
MFKKRMANVMTRAWQVGKTMSSIPLPALFARILTTASKVSNLPVIEDETQDLVQSCLADLRSLQSRITGLSLFSPNETLEDISTRDLVYLLVPFVFAEVQGRVRTTEREERQASLQLIQKYLKTFISHLEDYEIVPEDERALYTRNPSTLNPAGRRELKIKQFQKEKDIRARIEVLRRRRNQNPVSSGSGSDLDLIASILPPSPSNTSEDNEEDDSETDEILRSTTLLLLRLCFAQANSQLQITDQELELLRSAPPAISSPRPEAARAREEEDERRKQKEKEEKDMWTLDTPTTGLTSQGPLLDPSGKPLRPFTILPSGASDRARLQSQVFQPDHNLPTMTIDEYLEIERQRGNIITGGGPASEKEPTSSEQLALEAEMDGTREGEEKAEEKRLKDEKWAVFTDENPRGSGNTMNRG